MSKVDFTPELSEELAEAVAELVVVITPTGDASMFLEQLAEALNEKYKKDEADAPEHLETSTESTPVVQPINKNKLAQAVLGVLATAASFTKTKIDDYAVDAARAVWLGFEAGGPFSTFMQTFRQFIANRKLRVQARRERRQERKLNK